jgi:predicted ATPase
MAAILTPDQRVRVFVSSTLDELSAERAAAKRAIETLHLTPVLFELGARPHPPRELYRAYLEQSHVFVAVYWERYGWIAPDMEISGLEDELLLSGDRPKLVYLKRPSADRDPRLEAMLDRVRESGVSYKAFDAPEELEELLASDLASLLSERFQAADVAEPADQDGRWPVPLPVSTTAFVGREAEVDDVLTLLRQDDVRLVTLVGPGGIGKTRLALEVARRLAGELPDGVAYVPLEAIGDPELVGPAVLRALDVHERSSMPAMDVVRARLADRRILLVLDNLEHLLDAAGPIADLLGSTTGVQVLATSREPLRIRAEHQVQVTSLSASDAVSLFLDRARAGRGDLDADDLDAVQAICDGLDGVPLAVELAAACTRLLGPRELLERMHRRLDLLVAGPRDLPARQRALRSTIAWSFDLLDTDEQQVFAALGVFAGTFTEQAAADVTGRSDVLEIIAALVDKSMVVVEAPEQGLRLRMLGMMREFAVEQLRATGQLGACRARHAAHFGSLAREASDPLRTSEQTRWLDRLDADAANLRAGLDWWIEQGRYDDLADVAWYLWVFAWLRGYSQELGDVLRGVLDAPDLGDLARTRLQAAAGILTVQSGGPAGIPMLRDAVERARAEGQEDVLAAASMQLALAGGEGDMDEALVLFRKLGDDWGVAATLCAKAWVHVHLDAIDGADQIFDEALDAIERIDDDLVVAMVLANGAERAIHHGDDTTAAAMVADAVVRYQRLRAAYPASYAVEAAAHLATQRGRLVDAVRLVAASEGMRASIDVPIWSPARERHDRLIASLRERLEPAGFDHAWRSVDGLDYPGTLDLVLQTLDLVPGTR